MSIAGIALFLGLMFSVSRLWVSYCVLAAGTICPIVGNAQAQSSASLPPARTYYLDSHGVHKSVKERWNVGVTGEKEELYYRFNERGLMVECTPYNRGVRAGQGTLYFNLDGNAPYNQKRPNTKYVGLYRDGLQVGNWLGYDDATKAHVITVDFDADGLERSITYYKNGQITKKIDAYKERQAKPHEAPFSELAKQYQTLVLDQKLQKVGFDIGTNTINRESQKALSELGKIAHNRVGAANQIVLVYVAVYARQIDSTHSQKKEHKRLYQQSIKRAFAIRRFLARALPNGVNVIAYPCAESATFCRDGIVKISYTTDLVKDRQLADQLAYDFKFGNSNNAVPDEKDKAEILAANHLD